MTTSPCIMKPGPGPSFNIKTLSYQFGHLLMPAVFLLTWGVAESGKASQDNIFILLTRFTPLIKSFPTYMCVVSRNCTNYRNPGANEKYSGGRHRFSSVQMCTEESMRPVRINGNHVMAGMPPDHSHTYAWTCSMLSLIG